MVLLGWATSAFSAPAFEEVINIQLRWHDQFQFAGYYAALEKGFYKEEGLNVRLHAGDPEHQPVPEVLAGHAQYAEGNSEVLYQRLQGQPLVALAAIFQHSPSVLLTRADSEISSVHDLVGKKVMLMNMTEDADFISMFSNEGVALSQIKAIPSSYDLNDLISGKVDAFNSYLTNEPYFLKQRGISYNVIDPGNYRIDFYSDILFTTEAELRSHPQRVEAMRRATLKGWRYAVDHPAEIIDLLITKYEVKKQRDHLEFEASEMRKLIFPDLIEIGHMNPSRWQHMADSFVKAGLAKSDYSLDGFIYDPAPKRTPQWVWFALISGLLLLGVISSLTYYLYRLNRRLTRAQGTLLESEERFKALSDASFGGISIHDNGRIVECNHGLAELTGFSIEELIGMNGFDLIAPEHLEAVLANINRQYDQKYEVEGVRKNGERYPLAIRGKTIPYKGKSLRVTEFRDITDHKVVEKALEKLANTDALTGLANRGHFLERAALELSRSIRYARSMSVLMMDVDFLKEINDRHGHKVGDVALKKLSEVCQEILRTEDLIGRIGGEEFAIFLPETDQTIAVEVAERLRLAIAKTKVPMETGLPLHLTVSIGVTSLTCKDENIDVLLSDADKALYEAKRTGRNKVCAAEKDSKNV
jgi:diguanylate cyclase (GGDEF)-like protein/PAS domain S-box-containing protein